MLDNMNIADATAHGFNWTPENLAVKESERIVTGSWAFHQGVTADYPELMLTEAEFKQDWQSPDVAEGLFYEAGIDVICHHGTPIYDFFKDGHAATRIALAALESARTGRPVPLAADPVIAGKRPWRGQTR